MPGYYNLWDRGARLSERLHEPGVRWSPANTQPLQLDTGTGYAARLLTPLLPVLRQGGHEPAEMTLLAEMAAWNGQHDLNLIAPTLYNQFLYNLAQQAFADELGDQGFEALRRTRTLDTALPRLAADASSPWWDRSDTPGRVETRADIVLAAWAAALQHLRATLGNDSARWTWGRAHTVTHAHPLGQQKPLNLLFNVGPFAAPGGHETPNNMSQPLGPAPWAVTYGPSTRRIIDFAHPEQALGVNPVGQSGVWGDKHYNDQASDYMLGRYRIENLAEADVTKHTASTLTLTP